MRRTRDEAAWARHDRQYRDPLQVAAQWQAPSAADPVLLHHAVRGAWWNVLEATGRALIVTREYEHLVMALHVRRGVPHVSYMMLPHPNGLAVDPARRRLYVASTRNPNMLFELAPAFPNPPSVVTAARHRGRNPTSLGTPDRFRAGREGETARALSGILLPRRCWYLPGRLYLHDLAFIGRRLCGNAVGMNAVVELSPEGGFHRIWWPRSIERNGRPRFDRNHLQLNSIAAGPTLATSYFTASTAKPGRRRPGDPDFPVDRRGVVLSGRTREVVATGLTRPHSARLRGKELWLANSGYGEVGRIEAGRFHPLAALPGWTRGLCFDRDVAFVATSRVIPRFRQYAPGLDLDRSEASVHAVDVKSGRVLGSITWPHGNQIFAVELAPDGVTRLPLDSTTSREPGRIIDLFYRGSPE